MSMTKTIGVSGALILSAAFLTTGIYSRQSMDESNVVSSDMTSTASSPARVHQAAEGDAKTPAELKIYLEQKLRGMNIDVIEPSPLPGFYQAFFGGELIYVSDDGQFLFTGNMLELAEGKPINHSQMAMAARDAKKAPMRAETIARIDDSDMVVFKAKQEEFVITVFTDVDCGYCRKLHKEMPQLNEKGITVRYLAFPRAGLGSDAHRKLVSVWCSEDRTAAMNDAKLKRKFSDNECTNPLDYHYKLTRDFNLTGTPALILDDGELIGGYLPANELYAHLVSKAANKSNAGSGR